MARPLGVEELERASAALDRLIYDMHLGARSPGHFDELEERAQAIAARIVTPFRGERPARAAPLYLDTAGDRCAALF